MLPYPKYKYSLNKGRRSLYMSIVPIDHIFRPSYCIMHSDNNCMWSNNTINTTHILGEYRFYERAKRDSCEDFVSYTKSNPNGYIEQTKKPSKTAMNTGSNPANRDINFDLLLDSLAIVPMMLNEDQISGIEMFIIANFSD